MKTYLSILVICYLSSAIFGQTANEKIDREITEFRTRSFTGVSEKNRPSSRLLIVILYWSLFENLINRLFEKKMEILPISISEECVQEI